MAAVVCKPHTLPECDLRRGDTCLYTGLVCHPDCMLIVPPKVVNNDNPTKN